MYQGDTIVVKHNNVAKSLKVTKNTFNEECYSDVTRY